ncbi:MAG: TonB-dependent siderophore receptor [Cyanobacteria bacterium P01_F01_bin.143]
MRLFSPITYIIPAHVITTTVLGVCQPVLAQQLTSIVNLQVRETENGIELIVETADGSQPEYVETPGGNILYVDLVDAELNLASGKDFQIDNPTEEISSITVSESEEFPGSVSIVIQGTQSLPQVQLIANPQGGIFSITTSPATAQTTPIPPIDDTSSEQEIEILVRGESEDDDYAARETSIGRGSPQSVLETPRSVQTITDEVIKDQKINNISEITRVVSGINPGTVAVQDPGSAFVIRGFSAVSGRENLLRNGLRDDTIRLVSGIANIERVEVLKGPASVLFGQGIVGGSINLVTKKPLDEPFYNINLTAGNFSTYQGNIDFTAPIDPNGDLAYRLNIAYENEESFKNFQEEDFIFTDLVATLVKSEQTELNVGIEYQKSKFEAAAPQLPASGTVVDNPFGEVDIEDNFGEPSLAESEQTVVRLSSDLEHKFNDNWKLQNQFLASFQEIPEGIGFVGVGLGSDNRSFRRILNENFSSNDVYTINTNVVGEFNTGTIEHQLLVGLEFANQEQTDQINFRLLDDIDIFDPVYSPDSVSSISIPFTNQVTSFQEVGIYLQDQITLVDGLILALGGRYNIADSEFEDAVDPDLNSDRVDTSFTPSAGIIYQPTDNISFYASYAESFLPNVGRSRETDLELGQTILGDEFDPEEGRQFEIGVKAELFDDNILATLALFDLKRTNVLNPQTLSSSQVGEQKSRGIELDIAGEILPGWKIISSYAYTDTEIVDDEVIPDGNRLQNVPEHAFSIWTTYDIQQGSLEGLGFGLGFFFEGEKQGDLENSFSLPSYFRTDAALFYERDQFKAQLNVKNLFDIRYFESARDEFRVNAGAPFTISGTVSLEF